MVSSCLKFVRIGQKIFIKLLDRKCLLEFEANTLSIFVFEVYVYIQ